MMLFNDKLLRSFRKFYSLLYYLHTQKYLLLFLFKLILFVTLLVRATKFPFYGVLRLTYTLVNWLALVLMKMDLYLKILKSDIATNAQYTLVQDMHFYLELLVNKTCTRTGENGFQFILVVTDFGR